MNTETPSKTKRAANSVAIRELTRDQKLYNPCLKEHYLSYKCLNNNNFNQEKCTVYFENYKKCKLFWKNIMTDRRAHGISPALPEPEEREKLKAEYLSKQRK